jgi:NADPH:quinone reductase-like Zn-dependent oxidoreductase
MKAVVYYDYGSPDVLKCKEIERPAPGDGEVLIRVRAAALNPLDWRLMRGGPWLARAVLRLGKPTAQHPGRIGRDVAGTVEAVGRNVTRFNPGDEVFGVCQGAAAEYACAADAKLALKPASVTFEQAAAVPIAGITALQGLRDKGKLQPGQKVLIHGAAGGVGTFAVQIAKVLGGEVTGVCSTRNVEMVRSLGADRVIDYTREDFTQGTEPYDVILDNVGNLPASAYRPILKPKGICAMAGAPKEFGRIPAFVLGAFVLSRCVRQKFFLFMARIVPEDLAEIAALIQSGKVTPVIDRRYPLSETAEAMRYLEAGHARGKVIITLEAETRTPHSSQTTG